MARRHGNRFWVRSSCFQPQRKCLAPGRPSVVGFVWQNPSRLGSFRKPARPPTLGLAFPWLEPIARACQSNPQPAPKVVTALHRGRHPPFSAPRLVHAAQLSRSIKIRHLPALCVLVDQHRRTPRSEDSQIAGASNMTKLPPVANSPSHAPNRRSPASRGFSEANDAASRQLPAPAQMTLTLLATWSIVSPSRAKWETTTGFLQSNGCAVRPPPEQYNGLITRTRASSTARAE